MFRFCPSRLILDFDLSPNFPFYVWHWEALRWFTTGLNVSSPLGCTWKAGEHVWVCERVDLVKLLWAGGRGHEGVGVAHGADGQTTGSDMDAEGSADLVACPRSHEGTGSKSTAHDACTKGDTGAGALVCAVALWSAGAVGSDRFVCLGISARSFAWARNTDTECKNGVEMKRGNPESMTIDKSATACFIYCPLFIDNRYFLVGVPCRMISVIFCTNAISGQNFSHGQFVPFAGTRVDHAIHPSVTSATSTPKYKNCAGRTRS